MYLCIGLKRRKTKMNADLIRNELGYRFFAFDTLEQIYENVGEQIRGCLYMIIRESATSNSRYILITYTGTLGPFKMEEEILSKIQKYEIRGGGFYIDQYRRFRYYNSIKFYGYKEDLPKDSNKKWRIDDPYKASKSFEFIVDLRDNKLISLSEIITYVKKRYPEAMFTVSESNDDSNSFFIFSPDGKLDWTGDSRERINIRFRYAYHDEWMLDQDQNDPNYFLGNAEIGKSLNEAFDYLESLY